MVSLAGAAPVTGGEYQKIKRVKWRRATGRYREGTKQNNNKKIACQLPKSKNHLKKPKNKKNKTILVEICVCLCGRLIFFSCAAVV